MRTGHVYPALARVLEGWRCLSSVDLAFRVGASPEVVELVLDGEPIRIEVSASWGDAKRRSVLVEAVAYGPSSWLTERVSESLRIPVTLPK